MAQQLTPTLRNEYVLLWESCLVKPNRVAAASSLGAKVNANRARYETVGKPLGVPWFVVGAIHALESGLDFTRHLHNGDPLTARTTHVPAGRPRTGQPPFTWEESAADALALTGVAGWKDWSVAGLLYRLEAYNGFGYRNVKPTIPTPYLWSFSNHYARGKFVGDGSFSATAVSAQCGAAVLLKRLVQLGAIRLGAAPRLLQLANPHMTGPDVEEAQRLLTKNPYGDFAPGDVDGDYGQITAAAVERAKRALGYPERAIDGNFGATLHAYLDGSKQLPAGQAKRRTRQLASSGAPGEAAVRKAIVTWALWGAANSPRIAYSQGATRMAALNSPGTLPLATDCSGFSSLCYSWAKAPNPNTAGPYDPKAGGYTGTMLRRCAHISQSSVQPGDLVVWSPPADGHHVCIVVSGGANPWLVSHGDDSGPRRIRFSDEDASQRRNGHGTVTWLSAF